MGLRASLFHLAPHYHLINSVSTTHCALAHRQLRFLLLPLLFRGPCVDHGGWTSVVRLFAFPCGMRGCDTEGQDARDSFAEFSAIGQWWRAANPSGVFYRALRVY